VKRDDLFPTFPLILRRNVGLVQIAFSLSPTLKDLSFGKGGGERDMEARDRAEPGKPTEEVERK
jgi:hypothetical protein